MKLIAIFLISLAIANAGPSCLKSSEEYAVEAVIPSYDSLKLQATAHRTSSLYFLPAQYGNDLIALYKQTSKPNGLSIRIQAPTEIKEIREPSFSFVSESATGTPHSDLNSNFNNWRTICNEGGCELRGEDITIITTSEPSPRTTVEIRRSLNQCSTDCSGACIQLPEGPMCIDRQLKLNIDIMLRYAQISNNLEELLKDYRILSTGGISVKTIESETSLNLNWREALRQELVYLNNNGIITLSRDDIESISDLASPGQAGQNYRIIFNEEEQNWIYYDKSPNPSLTGDRDCKAYSLINETQQTIDERTLFYLLPLYFAIGIITSLVLLIILGRIITRKAKKKPYHS